VAENVPSWPQVAPRLAAARSYWLCTTTPAGAPHAAPVWGVVTGGTLYLYSERRTVKARNLAADPRVVVHLESGEDVVIVRGTAQDLGAPADVPEVVAALSAKYTGEGDRQYLPTTLNASQASVPAERPARSAESTGPVRTQSAAIEDVQLQCCRELWALARVNMSGSREPSRSSDDVPRVVVTSPPTGGSEFV
jgi:hypothetical protein